MRRTHLLVAVIAATALTVLSTAVPAAAEGNGFNVGSLHRLRVGGPYHGADNTPSDCGSIGWKDVGNNGDDSPIDSNDRALVANICPGDFAEAYTTASLDINRQVEAVRNISFDYQTNTITGAGEVYILAVTTEGNYLYLDPFYCSKPIGGGYWSRADFTGSKTGCAFYDAGGTRYEADGTQSALKVYAAAHPDDAISLTDMVFSASATVDRIALGTNRLYNYSNTRAFGCQDSETRC